MSLKKLSFLKKKLYFFPVLFFLLLIGQQCADVDLEKIQQLTDVSVLSSASIVELPTVSSKNKRYIFLVDMSNSMVSGPCPQDVGASMLFHDTSSFTAFDPNKNVGVATDHRGTGIGCRTRTVDVMPIHWTSIKTNNPNKYNSAGQLLLSEIPSGYETPQGLDYEGSRLEVLRQWITQARNYNERTNGSSVKVLIYPVTGGKRQLEMVERIKNEVVDPEMFLEVTDPKVDLYIEELAQIQNSDIDMTTSEDPLRDQKTKMGTTSVGEALPVIYRKIQDDMKIQYEARILPATEYEVIYMTDGLIAPNTENFNLALNWYGQCNQTCSLNPTNCGDTMCMRFYDRMIQSWGKPEENTIKSIDLKLGLIQSLTKYYGTSKLNIHLVQIRPERLLDLHRKTKEEASLHILAQEALKSNRNYKTWDLVSNEPPFTLIDSSLSKNSFELTHLVLLNPNVRFIDGKGLKLDTDGDGLIDEMEIEKSLDPYSARTHGVCLDSLYSSEAHGETCRALEFSVDCDVKLDSDGDGLNECEEKILGTDAYDFDTDGDGLPDSIEWSYGYNPRESDRYLDSNSDGAGNLVMALKGFSPLTNLNIPSPFDSIQFTLNELGLKNLENENGEMSTLREYDLKIQYIPRIYATKAIDMGDMKYVRSRHNLEDHYVFTRKTRVIDGVRVDGTNNILILARIKDKTDDSRFYWRILRLDVLVNLDLENVKLDLNGFETMPSLDFN